MKPKGARDKMVRRPAGSKWAGRVVTWRHLYGSPRQGTVDSVDFVDVKGPFRRALINGCEVDLEAGR